MQSNIDNLSVDYHLNRKFQKACELQYGADKVYMKFNVKNKVVHLNINLLAQFLDTLEKQKQHKNNSRK